MIEKSRLFTWLGIVTAFFTTWSFGGWGRLRRARRVGRQDTIGDA